ncbi:DNA replication and repair protein RecO [Salsuginibacillus halophilus]|uniref:DNA repair protein RecO n=1 Tax=Salsuginibacillus halophilus TaxID=517424 RepID=A0A2P8HFN0_9BACI|nr:DNA repair protein RecO [Salsuginibacillus halophilus]PSL45016.1 DNA replication and repair protein RecO [Salsuginibacillus halophilus]
MLQKVEGVVIRTVDYGESHVIVTLLTKERGKIAVMARGAKKTKSTLASSVQLFAHGIYVYKAGSGQGVHTLSQGDVIQSFPSIRKDLLLTAYASCAVELMDKATNDQERSGRWFELLSAVLERMNAEDPPDVLLGYLELKMTVPAGIQPLLERCVNCSSQEGKFSFSVREAGFLCHRCIHIDPRRYDISQASVRVLQQLMHVAPEQLGSISLKEETRREIETVIDAYYDSYAGLVLKSKRFLDQWKRWGYDNG